MAERHARKLQRLLHVRTLQLGLVRADEGRAAERVAQESMLRQRIAGLAADVAPTVAPAPAPAIGLQAAATLRARLHVAHEAADHRLAGAEHALQLARSATLEAKRDQSAIEKLIEQARIVEGIRERRALEKLPATPRMKTAR